MAAIVIMMLSLLPCVIGEHQEMRLIAELNNVFNFDHHIFLLDRTTDVDRFVNITELTPKSLLVFDGNNDNEIGLEIQSKNTFMIVVPCSCEFDRNIDLLHRLKNIQRLQIHMKIGIYYPELASTEELQKMFDWCREQLIINIFAATYPRPAKSLLNTFTYQPFGAVKMINVTGCTFQSFFTSSDSNFHQNPLKVESNIVFVGSSLWRIVCDLMNATFMEVQRAHTTEEEAFANGIDFVSQIYTQDEVHSFRVYTIKMEYQVIIFPEALPYPDFSTYLRSATSDKFFGYSLLTIVAVMLLLSICSYIKQKKFLIFKSIADVLNLLMNDNQISNISNCLVAKSF